MFASPFTRFLDPFSSLVLCFFFFFFFFFGFGIVVTSSADVTVFYREPPSSIADDRVLPSLLLCF